MRRLAPEDRTYTIKIWSQGWGYNRRGEHVVVWEESDTLDLSRLSFDDAEALAPLYAAEVSAHHGHIQWKRRGKFTWRVWEPGEERIECVITITPDPIEDCLAAIEAIEEHNRQCAGNPPA